jgi:hypothetical protein
VRNLGAAIIFTPITFTDDYHELPTHPYGILKGVVDSKSFRKGRGRAAPIDREELPDVLKGDDAHGVPGGACRLTIPMSIKGGTGAPVRAFATLP